MCTICFTDHNRSHLQALFADMWSWSMPHTLKTMIKKISKPYSLNFHANVEQHSYHYHDAPRMYIRHLWFCVNSCVG